MDIKAAFPSVVPECLFHNMHSHQVPKEYINWYKTCMTGRATTLEFNDYCSPLFQIKSSIDQGCPLSALAFLFYNADVLDNADTKNGELVLGFIDNIAIMARGPSFSTANTKLLHMLECPGGCMDWSHTHQMEFKIDKTTLVQASRWRQKDPDNLRKMIPTKRIPIVIAGKTVKPVSSHKFLGVIIDEQLHFKEQIVVAASKGSEYALACCQLAKPSLGIRPCLM